MKILIWAKNLQQHFNDTQMPDSNEKIQQTYKKSYAAKQRTSEK